MIHTRNRYLVFIPRFLAKCVCVSGDWAQGSGMQSILPPAPWQTVLKTLGIFLSDRGERRLFCYFFKKSFQLYWAYVNEVALAGWGLVTRRTNHVLKGLELWTPHPDPWGMERIYRWNSVTNGQWLDWLCLCDEISIKPQNDGVQRTFGLVKTWRCWKGGMLREGMEVLPTAVPCWYFALYISYIWLFLGYIFINQCFPGFCEPF